ncbi:hypothetical protein J6590_034843 [Homalodisca vitripennis]|nr:hypothetical protein J6590_034843 [Homalodisca vitripennis]
MIVCPLSAEMSDLCRTGPHGSGNRYGSNVVVRQCRDVDLCRTDPHGSEQIHMDQVNKIRRKRSSVRSVPRYQTSVEQTHMGKTIVCPLSAEISDLCRTDPHGQGDKIRGADDRLSAQRRNFRPTLIKCVKIQGSDDRLSAQCRDIRPAGRTMGGGSERRTVCINRCS